MKKFVFLVLVFSAAMWLWIGHMIAADGSLNIVSGSTTLGSGGAITGTAITNNNSTAVTFSNNVTVDGTHTFTGSGVVILGGNMTSVGNITMGSYILNTAGAGIFQRKDSGDAYYMGAADDIRLGKSATGTWLVSTNIIARGAITATNGYASYASDAGVSLTATGLTNALGKNGMAYVTATAVAFTIKDSGNNTLYTSPTLTATLSVQLHPGWSINAASGLSGTLLPE